MGAVLSSNVFHFWRNEKSSEYRAETGIDFEDREHPDWDMPVPALPTDIHTSF